VIFFLLEAFPFLGSFFSLGSVNAAGTVGGIDRGGRGRGAGPGGRGAPFLLLLYVYISHPRFCPAMCIHFVLLLFFVFGSC
jgi:hypothetical protein